MAIKHLDQLKSATYFGDSGLPCIVREMRQAPSNTFVAMHNHEFSELVVVAAGQLAHLHANGTETLHTGDFFVIHPDECHGYAELADGTVVFNLIYHNRMPPPVALARGCPILPRLFPKDSATVKAETLGRIPHRELSHFTELIKAIRREEKTKRKFGNGICNALFAAVVLHLARFADIPSADNSPVCKAIDFIDLNFARKIVIEELCEVSGMSASTLHRAFRRITGKSPGDYIIGVRAAKAQLLLSQPEATLDTVAHLTGFCNASHLSRCLRKR